MIITIWNHKTHHALKFAVFVVLFCVIGLGVGGAKGDDMKDVDFRVSIGAQPITFTAPPILKDGIWLVPLEHFAEQLGLKVEYPEGEKMVVLCGGTESERCVPLQFQDSKDGAIEVEGVTYARPVSIAVPFGFEIYTISPNAVEIIQPEHLAPEFTLPDLQDTPRHLRDFRGKKTLLYVWGSW